MLCLPFATLKTPTIKGEIFVSYKKGDTENVMDIIILGDAIATVYVPYDSSQPHLFVDGKKALIKQEKNSLKSIIYLPENLVCK